MIITHQNPDLDALAGCWLLQRFANYIIARNEPIEFVNTGNPDPEKLERAKAVVDTGKSYHWPSLRFDHHQFPGQASNNTCATKMIYEYLIAAGCEIEYLQPLVDLVFAGDTGRKEADFSRELGLHAVFSGWKAWWNEQNPGQRLPDHIILAYGFGLLDVLEVRLRKQTEAKAELDTKTVYKSKDGLVWAIKHGSQGSGFAAAEMGARIVIFEGEPLEVEGGTTYPVGIMRYGEWNEPHTGNLVKTLLAGPVEQAIKDELSTWFLHNAGFFSGRGTAKAPDFRPVEVDLFILAQMVDIAWVR